MKPVWHCCFSIEQLPLFYQLFIYLIPGKFKLRYEFLRDEVHLRQLLGWVVYVVAALEQGCCR